MMLKVSLKGRASASCFRNIHVGVEDPLYGRWKGDPRVPIDCSNFDNKVFLYDFTKFYMAMYGWFILGLPRYVAKIYLRDHTVMTLCFSRFLSVKSFPPLTWVVEAPGISRAFAKTVDLWHVFLRTNECSAKPFGHVMAYSYTH